MKLADMAIENHFVPSEIIQGYLEPSKSLVTQQLPPRYFGPPAQIEIDSSFLTEIEETYQRLKAELFSKSSRTGAAVTAIFGSHGTGVRTLMKSLKSQSGISPINLNAERFATALPSFVNESSSLQDDTYSDVYSPDKPLHEVMELITARYLPAGKYMHDRMMEEALLDERPIVISKRGRTSGGVALLKAFNAAEIPLQTILFQASLKLKLQSAAQADSIFMTPEQIIEEHGSITANMLELARQSSDHLSIYYRTAAAKTVDGTVPLLPIATGNKSTFSVSDSTLADAFNKQFALDVTVENLMKAAGRTQLHSAQPKSFARGFDLVKS